VQKVAKITKALGVPMEDLGKLTHAKNAIFNRDKSFPSKSLEHPLGG
jgi:hypothetical protein